MDNIFGSSLSECPYCNAMLSYAGDSCPYCGGDLTNYKSKPVQTAQQSNSIFDTYNKKQDRICPDCGYAFGEHDTDCPICKRSSGYTSFADQENFDIQSVEEPVIEEPVIEKHVVYPYNQSQINNPTNDVPQSYIDTWNQYEEKRPSINKAKSFENNNQYQTNNEKFQVTVNGKPVSGDSSKAIKIILIIFGLQFALPFLFIILSILGAIFESIFF